MTTTRGDLDSRPASGSEGDQHIVGGHTHTYTYTDAKWLVDLATGASLVEYKDADQEVTDTTLTSDSELNVVLAATSAYQFRAAIFFLNDGAAEGYKCALSGTVGVADLKAQISIYDDTTNSLAAFARITSLGSSVGAGISSGANFAVIDGTIETSTAGTFIVQFAQNAAGVAAGVHHEIGCSLSMVKLA